jgi:hypothetical protein
MINFLYHILFLYPPTQKATAFEAVDECVEGTLRSPNERCGGCFGGFRLPARSRFGEGRPYEACGGATGFSPWGLHQFPSKIWKRNSIIIFKNSHFIPHIYFTTSLGLINGDIDTLLPMAETKYLEGKPALVFTRQPDSP